MIRISIFATIEGCTIARFETEKFRNLFGEQILKESLITSIQEFSGLDLSKIFKYLSSTNADTILCNPYKPFLKALSRSSFNPRKISIDLESDLFNLLTMLNSQDLMIDKDLPSLQTLLREIENSNHTITPRVFTLLQFVNFTHNARIPRVRHLPKNFPIMI